MNPFSKRYRRSGRRYRATIAFHVEDVDRLSDSQKKEIAEQMARTLTTASLKIDRVYQIKAYRRTPFEMQCDRQVEKKDRA